MSIKELHDYVFRMSGGDIPVIKKEVYRYLGYRNITPDDNIDTIIDSLIAEAIPTLMPAAICEAFPIEMQAENINLGFTCIKSNDLKRNLLDSHHIILLAATIGPKFDRLMVKYSKKSAVSEAILQAIGAMFIESFLDEFQETLRVQAQSEGLRLRPRYSPGFGDVLLSMQTEIFKTMRMDRIGLTLCDSLLMMPSKSVTAIIGLQDINTTI